MTSRVHILGAGGTFMAPLAVLAKQAGWQVTASDRALYEPMRSFLDEQGIDVSLGVRESLPPADVYIVGNAATRGLPEVEWLLSQRLPMTSAPAFLRQQLIGRERQLIAVSGTHGKTTTSAMLTEILEYAGLEPGYLIGGVRRGRSVCALGSDSAPFVIEADEYDSAFFDKRSKFVHFFPDVLAINNIEFDHADIFPDLAAIERQFHHVIRTMPADARLVAHRTPVIERVIAQGSYCPLTWIGGDGWQVSGDDERVSLHHSLHGDASVPVDRLALAGEHMQANIATAVATAAEIGITPLQASEALQQFEGVERRLDHVGQVAGIDVYCDFAHHPTAIAATCSTLEKQLGTGVVAMAVLETNSFLGNAQPERLDELAASLPAGSAVLTSNDALAQFLSGHEKGIFASADPLAVARSIADYVCETNSDRAVLVCSNRSVEAPLKALLAALESNPDATRK